MLIFALCLIVPFSVQAKPFQNEESISSPNVAVYNTENDVFVYRRNADQTVLPSSTAKIMTGILALEHFEGRLDTKLTVPKAALRGLEGSAVLNLKADEEIPVRDLLYAMLTAGMNDAANVLAIAIGGSLQDFTDMMNRRAEELGAYNTRYMNPTGFDNAAAYTTAEDTARIAAHAYRNETFMQMCSVRAWTVGATNMHAAVTVYTRNMLISPQSEYFYSAARGMCYGYTETGGCALVSASDIGTYPYVCVVLGGKKDAEGSVGAYYKDVKRLLAWADDNFAERKLIDASRIVAELPVRAGRSDHVLITPESAVYAFLDADADLASLNYTVELDYDSLTAPVRKDGIVGSLTLVLDGNPIASAHLVTKTEVRRSPGGALMLSLSNTLKSPLFLIASSILMLLAAWILYNKYYKPKKGKYRHEKTRNQQAGNHQEGQGCMDRPHRK